MNEVKSAEDIAKIIERRSTRARILLTAAIGLPYSGTTKLVMSLLGRSNRLPDSYSNGIDMYQAVLFKDSVTNRSELVDITVDTTNDDDKYDDKDRDDDKEKSEYMILLSLAKFLITKHYTFPILDQFKDGTLTNFDSNPYSKNPEVSQYFQNLCNRLLTLIKKIDNPDDPSLKMKLTRSHSFINFFDININKAAYEVVFILGCTYESVILINVLNLHEYTKEKFNEPIKMSDESEEHSHLYELHKALEYFVHHIEGTYALQRERGNAILVGTHNNEFATANDLTVRVNEISQLINHYAELIQIDKALAFPKVIPVTTQKEEDVEKFKKLFFQVMDRDKQIEEYVPMKFFFLRCFLHHTNKLFITREKLNEYASACGLELSEIESFLQLFTKFCSLFNIKISEDQAYIVLRPTKFVQGLDKLYGHSYDDTDYVNGILTESRARSLWGDSMTGSISHSDFYISVLSTIGLMIEVESNYFLPSLRIKNDTNKPSITSNSMIILYNVSLIPFHKQCEFVATFTKACYEGITLKFAKCPYYNVVRFECIIADKTVAIASVRFCSKYLEISITEASENNIPIYSLLKTSCVDVLGKLCSTYKALRYKLTIVCPGSVKSSPHFMEFDPCVPSASLTCNECKDTYSVSSHQARHWVTSAYLDDPKHAIHPKGMYVTYYFVQSQN